MELMSHNQLRIQQRKELAELFGFETRNKYEIHDENGDLIGFAAEQGKGIFGHFARYFLGHWRRFEVHFFDDQRNEVFKAIHPFRWLFQRIEVVNKEGRLVASLQQRFSLLKKKFDVEDESGRVVLSVASPFWKPWTFAFKNTSRSEVAVVRKKWSGLIKEVVTDADNFSLEIQDRSTPLPIRQALVAAAIFIDLQYFENKANN